MSEYFKNKYRVSSTRLPDWDYSQPGLYFVTICVKGKCCCLGEIKSDNVNLSKIGMIVSECWINIPKHFDNVVLDDWIIMPNHVHGIIVIKDNDFCDNGRDKACLVSTKREFGKPPPKSLSSIIGSFKSAVANKCHKDTLDFHWQPNYYEHIIKDENDLARIKQYIANNPVNWHNDENNLVNNEI